MHPTANGIYKAVGFMYLEYLVANEKTRLEDFVTLYSPGAIVGSGCRIESSTWGNDGARCSLHSWDILRS